MNHPLHVHTPWRMIDALLPFLLENHLQPEVAFQASDLASLSHNQLTSIADLFRERGLSITVHAPFMDLNPGALDPLVANSTGVRLRQSIDAAAWLQAKLIVIHPGYDRWRYDRQPEIWLEKACEFFPPLLDHASCSGQQLALENIFEENPNTLVSLIDYLDHPSLGHCFDIGHWHLFGSDFPIDLWLQALGPKLFHLHLHDNFGKADDHLPLGTGQIDFAPLATYLKTCPFFPSMTLEAHNLEDLKHSLAALPKILHI